MQGIIIQGPTTYCKEIIDCYQDIPNVVFSTWDTEPQENIDHIKSKNIEVIQLPEPSPSGHLNINYQTLSTFNGIQHLKNKDVTEGLKIRSDYYINDLKLLLSIPESLLKEFIPLLLGPVFLMSINIVNVRGSNSLASINLQTLSNINK